eukprot:88903-Pyramimonas_sp.AAC.1
MHVAPEPIRDEERGCPPNWEGNPNQQSLRASASVMWWWYGSVLLKETSPPACDQAGRQPGAAVANLRLDCRGRVFTVIRHFHVSLLSLPTDAAEEKEPRRELAPRQAQVAREIINNAGVQKYVDPLPLLICDLRPPHGLYVI